MISIILMVLFIPVCLFLILVVLLQAGKGSGLAGAFGGVGGQTFLGARGAADFLGKLTIYMAIAFMALALILSITYGRGGINIRQEKKQEAEKKADEKPAETKADSTNETNATTQTPSGQATDQAKPTSASEVDKAPATPLPSSTAPTAGESKNPATSQ